MAAACWGDECDQLPKPAVVVQRLDTPITLYTQYGFRSLNALSDEHKPSGVHVLGLTRGNASVQFATRLPAYGDVGGRWECVSPQITVSYGFRPMSVYVARELPVGSCGFQAVYAHEQRHVKTYQDHLVTIEKRLWDVLNERFATGGPWRAPTGQISERLQKELNDIWIPYVQREIRRVEASQALIDTQEEYERLANACGGEIKARIF